MERQERRRLEREAAKEAETMTVEQVQPITDIDLGFDTVPDEMVDRLITSMALADNKTPSPEQVEMAKEYAHRAQVDYYMLALAVRGQMLMRVNEENGSIVFIVNPDYEEVVDDES
jgi:hypothetical protein